MIVTRAQHEAALAALAEEVEDPRHGILGPRSVTWRIAGDIAVFVGGGRAALLQLAHPKVAYAIEHHSHTRSDIAGRFQRTFRNVFAMVFGDLDDAFAAARRVHNVHTRIHGEISENVGSWGAGTPYHANDADSLRWVYATLVDTALAVRERLDGAVPAAVGDAYIVEMNRFAALFGIPRDMLAWSAAEHARYMQTMLDSGALAVAPCAREMGRFLMGLGVPVQPPLGHVAEALTASMLPVRLVHEFGLAPSRLSSTGVQIALSALAPLYRRVPRRFVALPARSEAARRLRGAPPSRFAAWTERQLYGIGRVVTGG